MSTRSVETALTGLIHALREPDPFPTDRDRVRARALALRVLAEVDALDAAPARPAPAPLPPLPDPDPLSEYDLLVALDDAFQQAAEAAAPLHRVFLTRLEATLHALVLERHGRPFLLRQTGCASFEKLILNTPGFGLESTDPDAVEVVWTPLRTASHPRAKSVGAGVTAAVLRNALTAFSRCHAPGNQPVRASALVHAFAQTRAGKRKGPAECRKILRATGLFDWSDVAGDAGTVALRA